MTFFLQCVFSGLSTGAVYGLAALCFVLIYKTTGILNLAQGAFIGSTLRLAHMVCNLGEHLDNGHCGL